MFWTLFSYKILSPLSVSFSTALQIASLNVHKSNLYTDLLLLLAVYGCGKPGISL